MSESSFRMRSAQGLYVLAHIYMYGAQAPRGRKTKKRCDAYQYTRHPCCALDRFQFPTEYYDEYLVYVANYYFLE